MKIQSRRVKFTMSCEVDKSILAFFFVHVKKLRYFFSKKIPKRFWNSKYARCVREKLNPNLCHFLTVAFIFLGDIFACECESEECHPESEESNPEISIDHEFWRRTCCSEIWERNLTRNILNNRSNSFLSIRLDEEEGNNHHSNTESEYYPFPYFSTPESWIENPTNKSNKREEVENIDEIWWNEIVIPCCLLDSEGNHEDEHECENNANKTNRLIRRFCLDGFDKFEHSWKIMNAEWV